MFEMNFAVLAWVTNDLLELGKKVHNVHQGWGYVGRAHGQGLKEVSGVLLV